MEREPLWFTVTNQLTIDTRDVISQTLETRLSQGSEEFMLINFDFDISKMNKN